ncbi:MAG: hypothetical protein AB1765_08100 [Candidatus Hydrogenedentota bacterium]
MRFGVYTFLMIAFNLILFVIVKDFLIGNYPLSKTVLYSMIAMITGNLLILYIVILRAPGSTFYKNFDDIFKKYYNGKNYDEAYKKAMKEWSGGRFKLDKKE